MSIVAHDVTCSPQRRVHRAERKCGTSPDAAEIQLAGPETLFPGNTPIGM